MNNIITKLIGLEGVILTKVEEKVTERHLWIELPRKAHSCPVCGESTDKVHDYREQKVKDTKSFDKHTILHLRKRRYSCPACGKRFFEDNSFLPRYYRITSRLLAKILNDFRSIRSATDIAKENNISVTTALRYFDLVSYKHPGLPEVLSIDEFKRNSGGQKYHCIIADAKNHTVKDILPNRKSADLTAYFSQSSTKKSVKFVVMDMSGNFRRVAEECFPNAEIIADKFHVVRQVMWALENVRKNEQKKLPKNMRKYFKKSRWILLKREEDLTEDEKRKAAFMLEQRPRLGTAYRLKNNFLKVMESTNYYDGKKALSDWIIQAELANYDEFKAALTAIHNWDKYILNSFKYPYSNGFTEGSNNKTKVLKRVAFGYRNFDRFRNRILHCASC